MVFYYSIMWNVQTYSELPSTQTLAREHLDNGIARHGDVFIALHQSSGRGQYHWREWYDEPGTNLLLSIVLTEVAPEVIDLMQFLTGLTVLATIRSLLERELRLFDPSRVQLKWPNDILLDGKKISGILSEAVWNGNTLKGIVIGIGINVNQDYFASTVATKAIGLKSILQYTLPLNEARDLLLATMQYTLHHYHSREQLLHDIRTELAWMGDQTITASTPDDRTFERAMVRGISDNGAMIIRASNGEEHTLQVATITFTL